MRFMVAALPVVWGGGAFSDEILFMVLKHLCPAFACMRKWLSHVISTIVGIVDQTAVKAIVVSEARGEALSCFAVLAVRSHGETSYAMWLANLL